jgi:hypothetical protein
MALVEVCYRLGLGEGGRLIGLSRGSWGRTVAALAILGSYVVGNAARDIRDYFTVWPQRGMVRLLYHADYREAADYLDAHPELTDIAVGSALRGPWDRIALEVDLEGEGVAARLFNPERALVWSGGEGGSRVLLPAWPDASDSIGGFLGSGRDGTPHLDLYELPIPPLSATSTVERPFRNGLSLTHVEWLEAGQAQPGQEAEVLTVWRVAQPLDLPPTAVVAHPPPPRTYTGPRLSVFAHLLDGEGRVLDEDDGLWVDPLTLRPGDRFIQVHRFDVPADGAGAPAGVAVGLYDPKTNERWLQQGADEGGATDLVYIPIEDHR